MNYIEKIINKYIERWMGKHLRNYKTMKESKRPFEVDVIYIHPESKNAYNIKDLKKEE